MKTYPQIAFQAETLAALEHLHTIAPGTVALRNAETGFRVGEPLLIIADQCIRYAKAYAGQFDQPISDDFMAAPEFSSLLSGFRALLNFDGAAKWEGEKSTDTKDNGMIESLYWTACEIAGIDGDDI